MRARVYANRSEAEVAQAALDRAHGLPVVHAEGTGPADYAISTPGRAAALLRDRGIRTEHYLPLIPHPDGDRFAVAAANPAAYVAFLQALAGGRPLVISPRDPQRAEIHRDVFARSSAPDPEPGPERCGAPGLPCCALAPGRAGTWCISGRCDRGVCR